MSRARRKSEPITEKERLDQERAVELRNHQSTVLSPAYTPEPTYWFQEGDSVDYGAFSVCVVERILDNGKAYMLRCTPLPNRENQSDCIRIGIWHQIRPLNCGINAPIVYQNKDIRIQYNNTTIDSILHTAYFSGINMDPDYQRDYVWSDEDRTKLLDSIFINADIGRFLLNRKPIESRLLYDIIDGKQRLSTLMAFYENRLKYRGQFYNDMNPMDRAMFLRHNIAIGELSNADQATVYRCFLMLNTGGKIVDNVVIDKVAALLEATETATATNTPAD